MKQQVIATESVLSKPMNRHLECREYRPGDEVGIANLYRDVFGFTMTPPLWHWSYQASPEGPAVIVILEIDGQVVGHYAVQPRKFWFRQQTCLAGLAVGTMVRSEVRSVAALLQMAKCAYELCRQRGLQWLYAFPNDQAHLVRCRLLDWRALPQIVEWDGKLPSIQTPVSKRAGVWREISEQLHFEEIFSDSAQSSGAGLKDIRSTRSADWLKWRFFQRPGAEYLLHTIEDHGQVVAYAVTKRYVRDGIPYGHILDLQMLPTAVARTSDLLDNVWQQFSDWQVERVSCWSHANFELELLLTKAGISLSGRKSNFCCFDLAGDQEEQLVKIAQWQVSMADSDVY